MSHFVRSFRRRKAFLDQLAVGASISFAAAAAGGTTQQFKRWRDSDPDFAKDWEDAVEEGTDMLEDAVYKRALTKSDPLAMFMLKARRPEKFDRGSKLELSGGISVEGSKAKLLNKIARLQAQGKVPSESDTDEHSILEGHGTEDQPILALPAPDRGGDEPIRGRKRRSAVERGGRDQAA